jgi:two-component system sensor kinase FixL
MPVPASKSAGQKRAEAEVEGFRAQLGPFVVAAEATRMAMLFTNAKEPRNPIIFANDSLLWLMGYSREELLARPFEFLFADPHDDKMQSLVADGFRSDSREPISLRCRRKDGNSFRGAVYVSAVRDDDGEVVQHFSSIVDLTEHDEHMISLERVLALQAELIQVARTSAMGTMATTLAHELNQPLAAITNYAGGARLLLDRKGFDAATLSADLAGIEKCALRAGGVIARLKSMTVGGPSKRETFDLCEAVRECVDLVHVGACQGMIIESCSSSGKVVVEADRVQIQQVVINLLKNGCEAAAAGTHPRVRVTTTSEGGLVTVSVDDTGPGLSRSAKDSLFKWANSTKPDGMGVGLSISRTIVQAHHGRLWLGEGVEGRTQFCFSLPRGD